MEINTKMKATLLSIGALAALLLAGCSQEAKSDMAAAGDAASQSASKMGDAAAKTGEAATTDVKKAGETVAAGAEKAGAVVVAGAEEAGTAVKNAGDKAAEGAKNLGEMSLTPKIKTALHAVSGLDVSKVDVDTDAATNTVTLKGSVPDAKQKNQAEQAAKLAAGTTFKVVNNLTVGG